MPITRRTRHAARSAYQLALMAGRYESTQCGMRCKVYANLGRVDVYHNDGNVTQVPIAKAWSSL